jgi:hypothetical protein
MSCRDMKAQTSPEPVYRYFHDEQHAEDFSRGRRVRISSLSACRVAEGYSGDSDEASMTYHGHIDDGSTSDWAVREILQRSSIGADPGITLRNITTNITYVYADAYLLCCTRERNAEAADRFGRFCVRINYPRVFAKMVHARLQDLLPLGHALRCRLSPVIYREREYAGLSAPAPPLFVKPTKYAVEREVRMVWDPDPSFGDLSAVYVSAPELSGLCARVS